MIQRSLQSQSNSAVPENNMEFSYEITQDDFFRGIMLHHRRVTFKNWVLRSLAAVLLLVIAGGVLVVVTDPSRFTEFLPLFLTGIFIAVLFPVTCWLGANSQFRKQPTAQVPKSVALDANGIYFKDELAASSIAWAAFTRWFEGETLFTVYGSPVYFYIIPKRGLREDQVVELRSILAQHIAKK